MQNLHSRDLQFPQFQNIKIAVRYSCYLSFVRYSCYLSCVYMLIVVPFTEEPLSFLKRGYRLPAGVHLLLLVLDLSLQQFHLRRRRSKTFSIVTGLDVGATGDFARLFSRRCGVDAEDVWSAARDAQHRRSNTLSAWSIREACQFEK